MLTDEQLAAIRTLLDDTERARARLTALGGPEWSARRPRAPLVEAAHALLAEVERLHSRQAVLIEQFPAMLGDAFAADPRIVAMGEIVEAVADETLAGPYTVHYYGDNRPGETTTYALCGFCNEQAHYVGMGQEMSRRDLARIHHSLDCPVVKARALLASGVADDETP